MLLFSSFFFFFVRSVFGIGSPSGSGQMQVQKRRAGRREEQEHAAEGSGQEPWSQPKFIWPSKTGIAGQVTLHDPHGVVKGSILNGEN